MYSQLMREIPLHDYASLDTARLAEIQQRIAPHRTLENLYAGAAPIADIIPQDEFTLDVIVPIDGGLTLVYAIT
jgi:hypothetical protein